MCKELTVKLIETADCFSDIPFHNIEKFKFLSVSNKMLKISSAKEPCTPNFSRVIKLKKSWIRVGPPPRSEPRMAIDLSHHGDELGLHNEAEKWDFDHVANLRYYMEQVTASLIQVVCNQDAECDLNPYLGSPSYFLSKLEKETKDFMNLGPFEYFLQKILAPFLQTHAVAVVGGLITATQWMVWAFKFPR